MEYFLGMAYHLLRSSGRRFAIAALEKNNKFNDTFRKMAFERKYPYMFCWVEGSGIVNSMSRR